MSWNRSVNISTLAQAFQLEEWPMKPVINFIKKLIGAYWQPVRGLFRYSHADWEYVVV
jgi:hypothetical protein